MNKIESGRGGLHQILEPIMLPETTNIKFFERDCTYKEPLLFISADGTYFEILGHRVETGENMNSMEDLSNWLKHVKETEIENEQLRKQMAELGEYVLTKYEEAKIDALYIDGVKYPNVQERIYEDILNRMELN